MTFEFRLESLLKIRRNELDDAAGVLAQCRYQFGQAEKELHQFQVQLEDYRTAHNRRLRSGGVTSVDLMAFSSYSQHLQTQIKKTLEKVRTLEAQIEAQQQAVIAANQEVKILEKLKEKQQEAYDLEQAEKLRAPDTE